jgi:hypothetical protein
MVIVCDHIRSEWRWATPRLGAKFEFRRIRIIIPANPNHLVVMTIRVIVSNVGAPNLIPH